MELWGVNGYLVVVEGGRSSLAVLALFVGGVGGRGRRRAWGFRGFESLLGRVRGGPSSTPLLGIVLLLVLRNGVWTAVVVGIDEEEVNRSYKLS